MKFGITTALALRLRRERKRMKAAGYVLIDDLYFDSSGSSDGDIEDVKISENRRAIWIKKGSKVNEVYHAEVDKHLARSGVK